MKHITGKFLLVTSVILTLLISGCAAQAFLSGQEQVQRVDSAVQATLAALQPAPTQPADSQSEDEEIPTTGQSQEDLGEANVKISLLTGLSDGMMSFVGTAGDLEGAGNPDIQVQPGDIVEITVENADNIQHNIALPDFGVQSADVFKQGETVTVKFKAESEGIFPYYCAIPGHRQAGMEGRLIVGDPAAVAGVEAQDLSRSPDDLPGPLTHTSPETVRIDLETIELEGRLADGTAYTFWTFNGQVPGPFLRVRVGDTLEVHLSNPETSTMPHSIDFHAANGPGGGAVFTSTNPGEETSFTFKVLNPGLYVYHCATPTVAHHISNGMYGLILVEPESGLEPVDREFYVMQGEVYTAETFGTVGNLTFSEEKLLNETPEYFFFNGSVGSLTALHPLKANVGETVRIYFGVGGPNFTSSFHVIGEIFDRVFNLASLTSEPLTDVQTTLVPPGGAAVVEFTLDVPGRYILVDHALSRAVRGLAGYLEVEGPPSPDIFDGELSPAGGH